MMHQKPRINDSKPHGISLKQRNHDLEEIRSVQQSKQKQIEQLKTFNFKHAKEPHEGKHRQNEPMPEMRFTPDLTPN